MLSIKGLVNKSVLLFLFLLLIFPFAYLVFLSFYHFESNFEIGTWGTFDNYSKTFLAIPGTVIKKLMLRSVIVSLISAIFSTVVCFLLVRFISNFWRKSFWSVIVMQLLIHESLRLFLFKDFFPHSETSVLYASILSTMPISLLFMTMSARSISSGMWIASSNLSAPYSKEFLVLFVRSQFKVFLLLFFFLSLLNLTFSTEVNFFSGSSRNSISYILESWTSADKVEEKVAFGSILIYLYTLLILTGFLVFKYRRIHNEASEF